MGWVQAPACNPLLPLMLVSPIRKATLVCLPQTMPMPSIQMVRISLGSKETDTEMSTPSGTRNVISCGRTGHNVQNCLADMGRHQPSAGGRLNYALLGCSFLKSRKVYHLIFTLLQLLISNDWAVVPTPDNPRHVVSVLCIVTSKR
jgi:hypothetical protein